MIGCALLASASNASAQTDQEYPLLTGTLIEEYSADVDVSGSILSGMWLGNLDDRVDPGSVFALLPRGGEVNNLCFSSSTRDGVYFAKAILSGSSKHSGAYLIEPMKTSNYGDFLSQYLAKDFSLKIRVSADCDDKLSGHLIPAAINISSNSILVAVNSRRSIKTEAWISSGSIRVQASCLAESNVRSTSYDTICTFDYTRLKGLGSAVLSIKRTPRAGPRRIDDYSVQF